MKRRERRAPELARGLQPASRREGSWLRCACGAGGGFPSPFFRRMGPPSPALSPGEGTATDRVECSGRSFVKSSAEGSSLSRGEGWGEADETCPGSWSQCACGAGGASHQPLKVERGIRTPNAQRSTSTLKLLPRLWADAGAQQVASHESVRTFHRVLRRTSKRRERRAPRLTRGRLARLVVRPVQAAKMAAGSGSAGAFTPLSSPPFRPPVRRTQLHKSCPRAQPAGWRTTASASASVYGVK